MRMALAIEYEGTHYHGWQRQDTLPTIQTHLEIALTKIANHPLELVGAGRTDRGVHAVAQVAHFDTDAQRSESAWTSGANAYLPDDIRVCWVRQVADEFHARYTAIARRYQYIIFNHPIRPAIFRNQVSWYPWKFDNDRMLLAANYLIGEHDFSAYRGIDCQAKSPVRNVHYLKITRQHQLLIIDIKANAFLHHMVRNIVGVLLAIGTGKCEPEWAGEVLKTKTRTMAGVTAPASGLYLWEVDYPQSYQFPSNLNHSFWFCHS
jgi:tRNA pseudouridine38-40 synthase